MFVKIEERDFPLSREQRIGLKPSEAIRRGRPLVKEGHSHFHLCAVGCAWAGVNGRPMTFDEMVSRNEGSNEDVAQRIFAEIGFDPKVGAMVHELHYKKRMPALEIAATLEEQGL